MDKLHYFFPSFVKYYIKNRINYRYVQQGNNMDGSHRYSFEVEKPHAKEYMLCDSIYMKFGNIE